MSPTQRPLETVILVDDSLIDNKLHKRIIERTGLVENVVTFAMAEEALDYLRGTDAPSPELILLDINMPRMDGFEMLDAARAELGAKFADQVVVMLTTSMDPGDQARARGYAMIRDYFVKPLTSEKFGDLVTQIRQAAA